MDECFNQSRRRFICSATAGPSCEFTDRASEQILNRTRTVQQIQDEDYTHLSFHSNENTSPIYSQEDRPIIEAGVDDAEVARKLQELFDKEYEMTMSQKKKPDKRQTRHSGPVDSNLRNEQQKISKEKKFSAKNVDVIDTTNDAVIAQQLQQELLMGDHSAGKPSLQDESQRKGSTSNFGNEDKNASHEQLLGVSKDLEERDRLYAQQLQEMESGQVPKGKTLPRKVPFTIATGADNSNLQDRLLARRLQEEEENKVRQGEAMLDEDEALARQLSETEKQPMPVLPRTVQKRHADSSPGLYSPKHARRDGRHLSGGSPVRGVASTIVGGASPAQGGGAISSSAVERVWHKKLFAMEKQAKKATAEQLQAIRSEQNERYKINQSGGLNTGNPSGSRPKAGNPDIPHTVSSPRQHPHIRTASSWNDESQYISLDEDGYITSSPPRRQPNLIPSSPNRIPRYSQVKSGSSGFGSMYSNPSSTSTSSRNQTDRLTGFQDHKLSQISSSFSSIQTSSRSAWDDDTSTQNDSQDYKSTQISSSISSTQSSSSCNITCGNCGEKGHNRNSKTCSRYYSLEETQHRQAKQEKARQRTEEKVQQEEQTREQLANHQKVLEDIAFRIQQEKDGLSDTIKKMEKKTRQRDKRKK
ncbi:uncharacterized protein LOC110462756 [Mizuhopecten yessoensis]|uniref:Uncharacterized protein n=1 Tax=Mizuhopecten yessoensis TaxID=6573 RepID=A0A210PXM5_MIZYE|nr:uncharacterized protein LOC110462756 [Mizuhopecten yessoensis]OWF41237.1 hypothetical protein KP79_PYT21417 [Mizuhopecten yessoensis]